MYHAASRSKGDRCPVEAAGGQNEAGVVSCEDKHGITGRDAIRGVLQRQPGTHLRARIAVVTVWSDVIHTA